MCVSDIVSNKDCNVAFYFNFRCFKALAYTTSDKLWAVSFLYNICCFIKSLSAVADNDGRSNMRLSLCLPKLVKYL